MNIHEKIGKLTEAICKAGFSSWAIFPHGQDDVDFKFLQVNLFDQQEGEEREILTKVGMSLDAPIETWLIDLEDAIEGRDEYVKRHQSKLRWVSPRWAEIIPTGTIRV